MRAYLAWAHIPLIVLGALFETYFGSAGGFFAGIIGVLGFFMWTRVVLS